MSKPEEIKKVADALYRTVSVCAECEACGRDEELSGGDSDRAKTEFATYLHLYGWRQVERLLCPDCVAKGLIAILLCLTVGCATTKQSVEVTAVYSGDRPEVQACYRMQLP